MRTALSTILTLPVVLAGCAARGNVELLESQLRSRENELFQVRQQLDQVEDELVASRREIRLLQQNVASQGSSPVYPETVHRLAQITGIRFDSRLTGALDRDGAPGDDELNVVVAPHDADNQVVKQEGTLELELLDLSQADDRRVIGSWRVRAEDVANHWHDGVLGKGIQLRLPWQQAPQSKSLTLFARFITPDGRRFETNQPLTVALAHKSSGILPASAAAPPNMRSTAEPAEPRSAPLLPLDDRGAIPLEEARPPGPAIIPRTQ